MQTDKPTGCVFCRELQHADGPENLIVYRGVGAFVIMNRYPYTSGHLMVVPYAHCPTFEELPVEVRAEVMELMTRACAVLREIYHPEGFNIGANVGAAAGAGVADHVHLHVLPRWAGDTNFMTSVGGARILPELLEDTYRRVRERWTQD